MIVCIDIQSLKIINRYPGDAPNQVSWGGPMGDPLVVLHLATDLDPDVIIAVRAEDGTGEITLVEDPDKVAQKTTDQWTSVRAQQKQQLYESDWTCSVTDYEVPNKSEWAAYRQALRDVTTQTDPFAIVWPVAPSE
jgi:hypothetical protein